MKGIVTLLLLTHLVAHTPSNYKARNSAPVPGANGILLAYVGELSGAMSLSIGIHVIMESSIGFRYDAVMEQGTNVFSHVALFYKFSDPYHSLLYNYKTHKLSKVTGSEPTASEAKVNVVGKTTIDSFPCTQLEHATEDEVSDYWMSPNVPGFKELLAALGKINPSWPSLGVSGTVFNWGGLVKMTTDLSDKQGKTHLELSLKEATKGLSFSIKDFTPPTN